MNTVVVVPAPTKVPPAATVITGPNYGLCGGGSFSYTVTPVPTATQYIWSGPAGTTVTGGQNTVTGTLTFPANYSANNGGVWVVARNACGSAAGFRYPVFSTQSFPSSSMTGPAQVSAGQTGVQYSLPAVAGAVYNWLVPAGSSIVSGQGSSSITVNFGSTSGNVSCDIVNTCGTGPRITRAVAVVTSRPAATAPAITNTGLEEESGITVSSLAVYPNPVQSEAVVSFNAVKSGSRFSVAITTMVGKTVMVRSAVTVAGTNIVRFNLGSITTGVYLVTLTTGEGAVTKRMVKGQ